MDPHEEIWKKETGQWYNIAEHTHQTDTFAPFNERHGFSVGGCAFQGTFFRFPLRNFKRERGISSHVYDIKRLRDLLRALREEAKQILLFLRSVRTVKVHEIAENDVVSDLLQVRIQETPTDQLPQKKSGFQRKLETTFESQSFGISGPIELTVCVQVVVVDKISYSNSSQSEWLVASQVGSQSSDVHNVAEALKVLPWVGVALEINSLAATASGGRVFCVLPMPHDVSCHLPVHVNATFSLNDERRELKWTGTERTNDNSAKWNNLVIQHLIPPCYAALLLNHAIMLLEAEHFYRAWPDVNQVRGTHWEGVLQPLFRELFSKSVFWSQSCTRWIKSNLALFTPRDTQLPSVVTTALSACGEKLVTVPPKVWDALDLMGTSVREITPQNTRAKLRQSLQSYCRFSVNQKLELLRYCLSDNIFDDLLGLALVPLANGTFTTFIQRTPFSVPAPLYLCSSQCPRYLLPNLEGELVDIESVDFELFTKLVNVANSGHTQLQLLNSSNVASLLIRSMPSEWRYKQVVTLPHPRFPTEWFVRFWKWITGQNLKLFSNCFVVPVFDSQVGTKFAVTRLSPASPSIVIPRTESLAQSLASALSKLGVRYCEQSRYPYVQSYQLTTSLINYFSANGVLDAIINANHFTNVSLTLQEASELRMCLCNWTYTIQRQATLRDLSIFVTLPNSREQIYSVTQATARSISKRAQVTPNNFLLSAENLHTELILFASSDYHQLQLLQSLSLVPSTSVDLLINSVFPLIRNGSIAKSPTERLMTEVLENIHTIISSASYLKKQLITTISKLPFIPVSDGSTKSPESLFNPSDPELLSLLEGKPVFPLTPFTSDKCLAVLKGCGLKKTVSPQEIVDIIQEICSTSTYSTPQAVAVTRYARAKAVIQYIGRWDSQMMSESVSIEVKSSGRWWGGTEQRSGTFSWALLHLSENNCWLPVQATPPDDYPICLGWKGSDCTHHFISFESSVVLRYSQASLAFACGSQVYFVDHSLPAEIFYSQPAILVQHILAHLEIVIRNHRHIVEHMRTITQVIYQFLQEHVHYVKQYKTLLPKECIWIYKRKKFVSPRVVALQQNPLFRHNLEPFVYTLPDDLEDFSSLFEAIGVVNKVSEQQIMGILEMIKDGSSESLGVSNEVAWELVTTILNWLTGNGEHSVDSSAKLYVPVESSSAWPTLVDSHDVVFTNNDFLRRYVGAFQSVEHSYTFVNHRVSPQMAHLLCLTPLSTYLDIAEDAFEDAGPNEPLTVRLKNILKDYKDGLTIIKELLQNADDAGASEMNICHDTRHHRVRSEKLFFPGTIDCHGQALVVHNNAEFTQDDFKNITKLAGATKEGQALKIGKFGVGFCSVYHITDIPSFISNEYLYIFDPTLTYLNKEIQNPAKPGKRISFRSHFIHCSQQMVPYTGLFGFNSEGRYAGTMFRFPFRTSRSELSSKIYSESDVRQLTQEIQNCSSKLLLFLQNVNCITVSQISDGQTSPHILLKIDKTTCKLQSVCIHTVTCSANSSKTTEHWLVATHKGTVLRRLSTASVACALVPQPTAEVLCYKPLPQTLEGEIFCFLPLSIKTGLPVHVSSNFAVTNNRTGIWTSDDHDSYQNIEEVQWNETLMKCTISKAYSQLLEALKQLCVKSVLQEYVFSSLWPLEANLRVHNPWLLLVQALYCSIERSELFFSASKGEWLTLANSRFISPGILRSRASSSVSKIPGCVIEVVQHLELPVVHLAQKYHAHLTLGNSMITESNFLDIFFMNINRLSTFPINNSRNQVLCTALECYTSELDHSLEERHRYLHWHLDRSACIPCAPENTILRKCTEVIDPSAYFAMLFDENESLFPQHEFCDKQLVKEAMKTLGMLHDKIPLKHLVERAKSVSTLYNSEPQKALKRVKLILDCLTKQKGESLSKEDYGEIVEVQFLPIMPKQDDYPLPWFGDQKTLYSGKELLMKALYFDQKDNTHANIAGSQVAFANQEPPERGGCGYLGFEVREILEIRNSPSHTEVICHFKILIKAHKSQEPSPKLISWADRISRLTYEFLNKLLRPSISKASETSLMTALSNLSSEECIWTGQRFVHSSCVATKWKQSGPYLFSVPQSIATFKDLQKALGIKEQFSVGDYTQALQDLKSEHPTPLPDDCQNVVKDIVSELNSAEIATEHGPFVLPSSDFVLYEAHKLSFNDTPWLPLDNQHIYTHKIVTVDLAKKLGVQMACNTRLSKYSVKGSQFQVKEFGPHEKLTDRICNILRDYPFDVTILKELLQNADDARATKMYVILDKRNHDCEHVFSEMWQKLQGPALLVWNDSVFGEKDLKGIQEIGLGSKRSDSETIGQYGIGFNAVYHLTDCPSFLTGGNTLCVLDPHRRYVPEASDKEKLPGAMYTDLDMAFWDDFDNLKTTYLRDGVSSRPEELLRGSLFRFPLRNTYDMANDSDIVKSLHTNVMNGMLSGDKMGELLKKWAPMMKKSLFFLNHVSELKFYVIESSSKVMELHHYYRTEIDEAAQVLRSELSQKVKGFTQVSGNEPHLATYPLAIIEADKKIDYKEEWIVQQGIGDMEKKVENWEYVHLVKPRHGIAAPLKQWKVPLSGQVFCFLPLPVHSGLPVHINGHFILNSTRRNLWSSTDPEDLDDKSRWNQNIMQAIASSYAYFLDRIKEHYTKSRSHSQEVINITSYYQSFPKWTQNPPTLGKPWLGLAQQVFQVLTHHNASVLAVATSEVVVKPIESNTTKRESPVTYVDTVEWHPLKNRELPSLQVFFWSEKDKHKLKAILERIGMKIACAPLWIRNQFNSRKRKKEKESEEEEQDIPIVSKSSVYEYYLSFFKQITQQSFPCSIELTAFMHVNDFKTFTDYLLKPASSLEETSFPKDPFNYPLLLTADQQLRVFDKAKKTLHSKYADLFPQCPHMFLHKDLLDLPYPHSYFLSPCDDEDIQDGGGCVCIEAVDALLQSCLPLSLRCETVSIYRVSDHNVSKEYLKQLWQCLDNDAVFKCVLSQVLKVWTLLLSRDGRLFNRVSYDQLLPIFIQPAMTEHMSDDTSATTDQNYLVKLALNDIPNVPILDTDIVLDHSLCPHLSDPKAILMNLYHLHKSSDFAHAINKQIALCLIQYFAKINFNVEPECCNIIVHLPLFETIDGHLTALTGKRVYIWPNDLCPVGCNTWLKGTDLVFLTATGAWTGLKMCSEFGICNKTAEYIYEKFIFPRFDRMSKQQRYEHLKHIRNYLFKTNFANKTSNLDEYFWPAFEFISQLEKLCCIGDDGEPLKPISSFSTHEKPIFRMFPAHFSLLPQDILGNRDEYKEWMSFFYKLNLKVTVSSREYLALCIDTAGGKLGENSEKASSVLVQYLFSNEENKKHGFHSNANLLEKISKIAFVCTVPLPELEWIHKVHPPDNCIKVGEVQIPMCKFASACPEKHSVLVWTENPVIRLPIENQLSQFLGVLWEPTVNVVLRNIENLANTPFANPSLLQKYTIRQCKTNELNLMEVMYKNLSFLQKELRRKVFDLESLKKIPCIPVHASMIEERGQFPVLFKPHRVVFIGASQMEAYYPFLHSVPNQLNETKTILEKIGVQSSLQLKHMKIVLKSAFRKSHPTSSQSPLVLEPSTFDIVKRAVKKLYSLLNENKNNDIKSMGKETITKQLNPLYLPGANHIMYPVKSLVYCDSHLYKQCDPDLEGTNLYLLWDTQTLNFSVNDFCALLPEAIRPKPLSKLCTQELSSSCKECSFTGCAQELQRALELSNLSQGMCAVVQKFSENDQLSEEFEHHLIDFFSKLEVHCIEYLKIDIILDRERKIIASPHVNCHIQVPADKSSYSVHLDAAVSDIFMREVQETISERLSLMLQTKGVQEAKLLLIRKNFECLLSAKSTNEVYTFLNGKEIYCRTMVCQTDTFEPKLGGAISQFWICRLNLSNNNIFHPQEWVGYLVSENQYIFAMVAYPVRPAECPEEHLSPIHLKYMVFTGVTDDGEGKLQEVKAVDLYKFTSGEEDLQQEEVKDLVPLERQPEEWTSHDDANMKQIKDQIRKELQQIWRLPYADRKKAIRRLYLEWHPDKNQKREQLAEEVFKFLLEELDKHEKLDSSTDFHSRWRTNTTSWDSTAREHRFYSQHYTGGGYSWDGGGWGRGGGGGGSGGGGGGGGGCGYRVRKNPQEGKRWVRQADVECIALESLLVKARNSPEMACTVCFMAHQVSEKALKGGMYALSGDLESVFLRSHKLEYLANVLESIAPQARGNLTARTYLLENCYVPTRYPNCWTIPRIPADQFSLSEAEKASENAKAILETVHNIFPAQTT